MSLIEELPEEIWTENVALHLSLLDLFAAQLTSRFFCALITREVAKVTKGILSHAHKFQRNWFHESISDGRPRRLAWLQTLRVLPLHPLEVIPLKGSSYGTVMRALFTGLLQQEADSPASQAQWLLSVFGLSQFSEFPVQWQETILIHCLFQGKYVDLVLRLAPSRTLSDSDLWTCFLRTMDAGKMIQLARAFKQIDVPFASTIKLQFLEAAPGIWEQVIVLMAQVEKELTPEYMHWRQRLPSSSTLLDHFKNNRRLIRDNTLGVWPRFNHI